MAVEQILAERGSRYGSFEDHSEIAQSFKKIMQDSPSWEVMTPPMRQSMEMFADKMARILNGDPTYDDSWVDIAGYSQLVVNILQEKDK